MLFRSVKRVVAADGRVLLEAPADPEVLRAVDLDPEVIAQLKAAMEGVVADKRGTGHRAVRLPRHRQVFVHH